MYKIAAFIEFDKKIKNIILQKKKEVKQKFGFQTYLDHPVHLTLFTIYINNISKLKKTYLNLTHKISKPFYIYFTNPGIFRNDPLTGGDTFFYKIKKNRKISELQINHLKKINKNLKVFKKKEYIFKDVILKKNYKAYGFPFVGDIWIPHVTVASIKNFNDRKFVREFLSFKPKLKYKIKEIKFYKIINEKHIFLFNVKNF